jgi:hypothetical protein
MVRKAFLVLFFALLTGAISFPTLSWAMDSDSDADPKSATATRSSVTRVGDPEGTSRAFFNILPNELWLRIADHPGVANQMLQLSGDFRQLMLTDAGALRHALVTLKPTRLESRGNEAPLPRAPIGVSLTQDRVERIDTLPALTPPPQPKDLVCFVPTKASLEDIARSSSSNLTILALNGVQINNTTALATVISGLGAVGGLEHFADLNHLAVYSLSVADFVSLANVTALNYIDLDGTKKVQPLPLTSFTNLKTLGLIGEGCKGLSTLSTLPNLTNVYLRQTAADSSELGALTEVKPNLRIHKEMKIKPKDDDGPLAMLIEDDDAD